MNIDGVTNYLGLLQNSVVPAFTNITIQDIGTTSSNGSNLADYTSYLCQPTFGSSANGGIININNCYNTGTIGGGGGYYTSGLLAYNFGVSSNNLTVNINSCYNTGTIGGGGGGYCCADKEMEIEMRRYVI